jgi:hypothetical protein
MCNGWKKGERGVGTDCLLVPKVQIQVGRARVTQAGGARVLGLYKPG